MPKRAQSGNAVEAEWNLPEATVRIVRSDHEGSGDQCFPAQNHYRLDCGLISRPRNSRACFSDHWGTCRFEPVGDIVLVPPGQSLLMRREGGDARAFLVCALKAESVAQWLVQEPQWPDERLVASLDIRDVHIHNLLQRLAEEVRHPVRDSQVVANLITGQLAIEIARWCVAAPGSPAQGGLADWRLRLIDERLQVLRAAPTLAELAELCRLSVRQLTRGFRISRGCSIGDHVASCRMDHARRLLAEGESVKSIAYSLGFSSPSSFCYAFRQATGQTPTQFRKRLS